MSESPPTHHMRDGFRAFFEELAGYLAAREITPLPVVGCWLARTPREKDKAFVG